MKMKGSVGPRPCLTDTIGYRGTLTENIKKDYDSLAPLCVGCGDPILDQFILRVSPDLSWHAACLKFLDETKTCFVREGKTYCKQDYMKLFGYKCEKCHQSFKKEDFVMRANNKIFHTECFRCIECGKLLATGDCFALREEGLYCNEHHKICDRFDTSETGGENNNNKDIANHNRDLHSEDGDDKSEEGTIGDLSDGESLSGHDGDSILGDPTGSLRKSKRPVRKTARARTVLSEKQLNILKTCYSANPRPDALMKEQLVEMTGLSARVIRVWFQNKRCKDGRKIAYGGMQGIPMIATSPVRHDPPIGVNPVDIHGFQPPWKSLTDFALHDLDRMDPNSPQFQHLVGQMHGYPDMVPPPGCRPLPPGPPPPPDMMYGPPPDHLLGPHHPDHLPPPEPDSWSREGGPPTEIFPPRDGDFSYLDTSDDSGRHTGPDQPSP